jgi:iron complex outermembrane receptor protein
MYRSFEAPLAWAAAIAVTTGLMAERAAAQSNKSEPTPLPPVVVEQSALPPPAKLAKKQGAANKSTQPAPVAAAPPPSDGANAAQPGVAVARTGSLSVPNTDEARAELQQTPGSVELVPAAAYKGSTPSATIKDALDYVPGVFVQTKWGDDTRLSIRGSGLSRNFHLRGLQLYMDGIPINTADGFGDFQEIDPTAYRYIEVYKGANALRFGANSLGGAINFVMPTGYDADAFGARTDFGSFGFHKLAASSGGVAGPADYFITGTWQETDGFRDHSWGESVRGAMNIGYRLSEDAETRFYFNANWVRQRIPGAVTKESALTDPEAAAAINVANDWQRNIDTVRIANKTAVRLAPGTLLEFGAFGVDRQLMHPIFRWLDYKYDDYGAFARLNSEQTIAGFRNRLIVGADVHNGTVDAKQYNIGPNAQKLNLLSAVEDDSENVSLYAENSFYFLRDVALVTGTQYLHATRAQTVTFTSVGDPAGKGDFDLWSPKAGLLWDVDRSWQVFANVSRSAEIPSFGENTVATAFQARAQRATTYEIGTRGSRPDYTWDLSLYRAEIDDELQCITIVSPFFTNTCSVTNADSTVHQGVEAGFGAALLKSLFVTGRAPDKLWLNAAYTFSDFRFADDVLWSDNALPGAPRHYVRAELLYKHPSGVYAGPNVEWVPEAYFVDNANTLKTAAYAIWGMKLGVDNGGAVSAYIEGRNLSDEAYIASASVAGNVGGVDTAVFEPGTGRAFYGGVQVRW